MKRSGNPESGYAVLFVFAMASMVAIGLYSQLPRAAFEAQREKEMLLINHGEQYKRGVQLYVRKMGRYPAAMTDLENTQNIRFLRKRFFDPMTGKEEWRLIHMGPNGKLLDSKNDTATGTEQFHTGSITEFHSAATGGDDATTGANIATRKRPSDDRVEPGMQGGMMPGASSGGGNSGSSDPNAPPSPPSYLTGGSLPGMPNGQKGIGVPQNPAQQSAAASSASQGSSVSGNGGYGSSVSGNGGFGPTSAAGMTAASTAAAANGSSANGVVNSQFGGQSPQQLQPGQTYPGYNPNNSANGFQQPGTNANAANMINNLLTNPRPGGAPAGIGGTGGPAGSIVGGLCGVASTVKGHSVIQYGDQDDYSKWEFYYDLGAEQAKAVQSMMPGQTNNVNGPGGAFNSPGGGAPSSGFGNSSGFAPPPAMGTSGTGGGPGFGGSNPMAAPPQSTGGPSSQ